MAFTFLKDEFATNKKPFTAFLKKIGDDICEYAKDYFTYQIEVDNNDEKTFFSLIITSVNSKISHRIFQIEIVRLEDFIIRWFDLEDEYEFYEESIYSALPEARTWVEKVLNTEEFNETMYQIIVKSNISNEISSIKNTDLVIP